MIPVIVVFAIAYIFIATEKLDKTAVAILASLAIVGFKIAPYEELAHKIDLNVLFLLVGMMVIVNILSRITSYNVCYTKLLRTINL